MGGLLCDPSHAAIIYYTKKRLTFQKILNMLRSMKLKRYIRILERLAEKNPDALEYEVVYGKDDEGNGFDTVKYAPSIGVYEDGEFDPNNLTGEQRNAVCLN